jgi:hypothetical protein
VPSPSLPLTSPATRRNREPRAAAAAAVPSEVEPQIPGPRRAGLPHWLRGARVQAMRGARQVAGGYSRRASPDSASATRRLRWDPGWLLLDRSLDACVRRLRPHATSRSAGRLQSTNLCFGVPPLNRRSRQQKIPVGSTSIDPGFPVWCCPLADRSMRLHGRTARSLLSHSGRILWTPAGVHTTSYMGGGVSLTVLVWAGSLCT